MKWKLCSCGFLLNIFKLMIWFLWRSRFWNNKKCNKNELVFCRVRVWNLIYFVFIVSIFNLIYSSISSEFSIPITLLSLLFFSFISKNSLLNLRVIFIDVMSSNKTSLWFDLSRFKMKMAKWAIPITSPVHSKN